MDHETSNTSDISRTTLAEVPLGFDEVLYSRTDLRGVILAANEVFQRVSGFEWDRLLGAPHKVIRHPEMPKAVFWLLWNSIQRGEPIGAYVRNRSLDGRFYWVFAVVMPVDGGYLSVRIKPSSPLFKTIEAEYAALVARETQENLGPEASARALCARLAHLGFSDYRSFMAQAVAEELARRDAQVGKPEDKVLARVRALHGLLTETLTELDMLVGEFGQVRSIPTNLRIAATRMEAAAAPISALSENYRIMSGDIVQRLDWSGDRDRGGKAAARRGGAPSAGFSERMRDTVSNALFMLGGARIQSEILTHCALETREVPGIDRLREMAFLRTQHAAMARGAERGLVDLAQNAARLGAHCTEVRRMILGLDSIRVMCRVEHGRLGGKADGLAAIIDQLDRAHSQLDQRLDRVTGFATRIRAAATGTFGADRNRAAV